MGIEERRTREREARRKLLLDAARELVVERGFVGTTTRKIAARCELSEATLFWYFGSKDEILVSLLFEGIDFMARGLEAIAAEPGTPRDRLAAVWRFFARVREEHPEYFHVFHFLSQPQSTTTVSEEVRAELLRRSGENLRRLAALLEEGAGGADPRVVADVVWSAFVGLMVLRDSRQRLGARPLPGPRELEAALEVLAAGLLQPQGARGASARKRKRPR